MSNDWKELDINNRKECCDVLAEADKYEFIFGSPDSDKGIPSIGILIGISFDSTHFCAFESNRSGMWPRCRYRLKQNIPSHKDIMTKWWGRVNGKWVKIMEYDHGHDSPYVFSINNMRIRFNKKWFINRESADIPPEY